MCLHTTRAVDRALDQVTDGVAVNLLNSRGRLVGAVLADIKSKDAVIAAARDLIAWHPEAGEEALIEAFLLDENEDFDFEFMNMPVSDFQAKYGTDTANIHTSIELDKLSPEQLRQTLVDYGYFPKGLPKLPMYDGIVLPAVTAANQASAQPAAELAHVTA